MSRHELLAETGVLLFEVKLAARPSTSSSSSGRLAFIGSYSSNFSSLLLSYKVFVTGTSHLVWIAKGRVPNRNSGGNWVWGRKNGAKEWGERV